MSRCRGSYSKSIRTQCGTLRYQPAQLRLAGKSLIDNTCPEHRAHPNMWYFPSGTGTAHSNIQQKTVTPQTPTSPPLGGTYPQGDSRDRHGQIYSKIGTEAASKFAQGTASTVGHPLFSNPGMPAVQHSTVRSRGTNVTSV